MSDNEILRLLIPKPLADAVRQKARAQFMTVSAYVRFVLAQDTGLIELPTTLVDTREIYEVSHE